MTISGSAIVDALLDMLSASTVFGTGGVTRGLYNVLETASACCAIVQTPRVSSAHENFGTWTRTWTIPVDTFYAEEADASLTFDRLLTGQNAVLTCLEADESLLGTVDKIVEIEVSDTGGVAMEVGGRVWLPCPLRIVATEML